MNSSRKRLLVVDIAALGWNAATRLEPIDDSLVFREAEPVFPAVTCVAQATFRTALTPSQHGMVANGVYSRDLRKPAFWEQSSALVEGERIWTDYRKKGHRVGLMFWQQSLGEDVDLVLSPKPIHKHSGGMIQHCYAQPPQLYEDIATAMGRGFNLMHYWGPLASRKSSEWIVDATCEVLKMNPDAPDLLLSYLPHLDYDMQRFGPDSSQADKALAELHGYLTKLYGTATAEGYDVLFFGDYAIRPVNGGAVYPNRALRDAGLFDVLKVRGMAYPDFFRSDAFAMVDHETAHVYLSSPDAREAAADVLRKLEGVADVLDKAGQERTNIAHERSGELVLIAEEGRWFAYPWWTESGEEPDYAGHVDIHNKPGYDPCELFFGWPPMRVSRNTTRIKGSHGSPGSDRTIAWASTCELQGQPANLVELSRAVRSWLDN